MSLVIEFTKGPLAGKTFNLDKNTSLGRQGDIPIPDPKLSKIHAFLKMEGALGWLVEDNRSKNGLMVNGKEQESHLLSAGDVVELGGSEIKVISVSVFWKPLLNQLLIEAIDKVKNKPLKVRPFHSIPVLKVIQGIQYGEQWLLEYGPRKLGGECEDIQLFEPKCPDLAFEILHGPKGALFFTEYPKIVKINDRSSSKKLLKKGDRIQIYNTVIEVDLLAL